MSTSEPEVPRQGLGYELAWEKPGHAPFFFKSGDPDKRAVAIAPGTKISIHGKVAISATLVMIVGYGGWQIEYETDAGRAVGLPSSLSFTISALPGIDPPAPAPIYELFGRDLCFAED